MSSDLEQLQNTFLEEAAEHLQDLEQGLLQVEEDPTNLELFQGVFRAAHSIKGGSGLFGFDAITRLTHALENVLDRMRKATLEPTTDRIDVLLRAVDCLRHLLDDAKEGRTEDRNDRDLIEELTQLLGDQGHAAPNHSKAKTAIPEGPVEYRVVFAPHSNSLPEITDPLLLLRNLAKRGKVKSVSARTDQIPLLDQLEPTRCYLSWEMVLQSELGQDALEGVFDFVREFCELEIQPIEPPGPGIDEDGNVKFPFSADYENAIEEYLSAESELFTVAVQMLSQFDHLLPLAPGLI